ncbi:hypothetical protein QBC34DRAFT_425763 [Podospora aff. communis PSN243]|uniref:Secreted protein n=1 Tax=Podospora aff. communis PSN243 TaxID=3040156 RepID=A0AAV9GPA7_9PEZI|nr:hypothetical protein QBC34DRAFT_425763 [Podospora aff. communis PSN243]
MLLLQVLVVCRHLMTRADALQPQRSPGMLPRPTRLGRTVCQDRRPWTIAAWKLGAVFLFPFTPACGSACINRPERSRNARQPNAPTDFWRDPSAVSTPRVLSSHSMG